MVKKKGKNISKSPVIKDKINKILALLEIENIEDQNNNSKNDSTLNKKIEDNTMINIIEKGKNQTKDEKNETLNTQICNEEKIKGITNTHINSDNQTTNIEKNTENELKNYENEVLEYLKEEKANIIQIQDKKEVIIEEKHRKKK